MAPYADSPPRRPLLLPVLIATVFLAVIGLSVGLVMGTRAQEAAPQGRVTQTTAAVPAPTPGAAACRPETQDASRRFDASGTLVVLLQVRTDTSTAWICTDDEDRLFYHANRGGESAVWIEGETALFLSGVVREAGGYRATVVDERDRETVFNITRQALSITHADGKAEVQPVREVVVG